MKKLIFLFLLMIFLVSGCTENTKEVSVEERAIEACIKECENRLNSGINLSEGPCLSDNDVNWMIENWVCDVAHRPREEVDNLEDNQCKEYKEKKAEHFVEVNPDCELIRAV